MPLDKELLEIIACPNCKGDLIYEPENERLICEKCSVYYPIRDDIPILLVEEPKNSDRNPIVGITI